MTLIRERNLYYFVPIISIGVSSNWFAIIAQIFYFSLYFPLTVSRQPFSTWGGTHQVPPRDPLLLPDPLNGPVNPAARPPKSCSPPGGLEGRAAPHFRRAPPEVILPLT